MKENLCQELLKKMTTPSAYLTLAADLEEKVALLYRAFAARFKNDAELESFFSRMAEEEDSHRNAFHMLIRVMRGFTGEVEVEHRFEAMAKVMNDDLNRALKLLSLGAPLAPSKALELAVKLETTFIESHGGIMMATTCPDLQKTLDMLNRGSLAHRKRIQEFMATRAEG